MKRKRKGKVDKEKMCEDWCFVCKDGGSLFICEYKDCLKAYHAECVEKDESFFESGGVLTCEWHSCFLCRKRSKYQCYCCPRAFCERCISVAEFAKVRGSKGFCSNCLKVLLLGEEQKEVDSDGDQVDMTDRNTYECLLFEYWLAIKGKENLSLKDLHFADNFFKRDEIQTSLPNPSGSDKYTDESSVSTSEDSRSDFSITPVKKGKRSKGQKASKKTEVKSKKKEFASWGSKPLIDFLVSIGKDTRKELSENEVEFIINRYIVDNRLFNPEKKKEIMCDEKLHALFGKKTFKRNSISNLLRLHFRENAEFDEQDQLVYGSEETSESKNSAGRKQKKAVTPQRTQKKEVVLEPPRSCYASISMENIKLVYLKKCLVMELLKEPETFESKIIGSFVKVKSDPNDCMQINSHQLVQVTGVKNASPGGKKEEILLQVTNMFKDFSISMLSDANFSKEECEDLGERVKSGQLKKLTIVELEGKAKSLHLVLTKHWIANELILLQNRIDRANEKGQRAELSLYMEKKMLLETEAEKTRLLEEVPKVIADVLETEPICDDVNKKFKHGDEIPQKSLLIENSKILDKNWGDNIASTGDKAVAGNSSMSGNTGCISANNRIGPTKGCQCPSKLQDSEEEESVSNDQYDAIRRSELLQCRSHKLIESNDVEHKRARTEEVVPIESRRDSDCGDKSSISFPKKKTKDFSAEIWLCLGPDGEREGPFAISDLKKWGDISPYALKFKVWKTGENEENAILLGDTVSQFYGEDWKAD